MEHSNVRPLSTDTAAAVAREIAARDARPIAQRERMIATAQASIADLVDSIKTVEAGLSVLLQKQTDAYNAADEGDREDIADLRQRIDDINARREERRAAHEQQYAAAGRNTAAEIAALKDMLEAQRGVVAALAKDVSQPTTAAIEHADTKPKATRRPPLKA